MLQSSKCMFVCLDVYSIHIAAHLTSVAHNLMYFRYIDPSYMIRSVPANATDTLYCMQLGQNAVHGTMAGYTGFSVGLCNNKMCLLPIPELVATSPRQMNPKGRTWCVCIVVSCE
jgi:6-phosphofructokinase